MQELVITEQSAGFVYNDGIMNKILVVLTIAVAATGCNKTAGPSASATASGSPAKAADAVQQKLIEVAGSSATDCGRFPVQTSDVQLKTAGDCAMQAAQGKKPFYIGYDMPGMTVAVAGTSEGKLYSVQVQERGTVTSEACPSEIRVAPSGRVTCFAPGKFGGGAMGADPHSGMPIPPAGGMPPSGATPPSGMINPHAVIPPAAEGTPNPRKGSTKPPAKQQ